MLKIQLVYREEALGEAWRNDFADCPNVEIISGDILQIPTDAIVSPANSFGFMDGGLDLHISETLSWHIEENLQNQIAQLDEKELLIGKSITIETGNDKIPYLISAPTMRVPMSFNIATSVNAYLAMKAILIAATKNDKIQTVSIPGLCTGCGRMPFHIASNQMFLAYDEVINGNYRTYENFGDAQKYQYRLNEKGFIWDY
ncbi:macro domain-containing protein [Flavobacterium columnare]|uniref:macro domain-containing protein n=1 Tax=Flavobacterium columnare TaxID=996 RepID=UPI002D20DB87|nr:macro domain-containing protein [Flavobacterium columnare]MEB3801203.1 macro domain-containing protein [Flavobacterium columnare]